MKTPSDPTDPLLQSLAEETADLPLRAAGEARKARALGMKQRRQIALTITVLFCGVCAWQVFPPRDTGGDSIAFQAPPDAPVNIAGQTAPPSLQPSEYVIVRTEEQAMNEPLPMPDGLTKEQENVVKAARGLPLLLVRNSTGKVTRIHVIER